MPIGIDREIEGNKYTIAITEMEFTAERATISAVMNLNFPQIGNKLIAFGVTDLCINPGGLGDEGDFTWPGTGTCSRTVIRSFLLKAPKQPIPQRHVTSAGTATDFFVHGSRVK